MDYRDEEGAEEERDEKNAISFIFIMLPIYFGPVSIENEVSQSSLKGI